MFAYSMGDYPIKFFYETNFFYQMISVDEVKQQIVAGKYLYNLRSHLLTFSKLNVHNRKGARKR